MVSGDLAKGGRERWSLTYEKNTVKDSTLLVRASLSHNMAVMDYTITITSPD